MGKKLDAMLGRIFKTTKFKSLLNLTITRLGVLKNQRRARCSLARKDVLELLKREQKESALLRVEHVIKDQNILDVFVLIEGFCHLLMERATLIENEKTCPNELKEAISSLIFVSSRVGGLPELLEVRSIFTRRFGKEFTSAALELRGGSGVNVKMIQKMSTTQPSLDTRLQVLKEIALEDGIQLNIEDQLSDLTVEGFGLSRKQSGPSNYEDERDAQIKKEAAGDPVELVELEEDRLPVGSVKARKYTDVAAAAQAAFESAAAAAAAARAAVELSKRRSVGKGFDGPDHSNSGGKSMFDADENEGSERTRLGSSSHLEVVQPVQDLGSEPDDVHGEDQEKRENARKLNSNPKRSMPSSRSDSNEAPQEQSISSKKQDSVLHPSDSQVTMKDQCMNSRTEPCDYEEKSQSENENKHSIWKLRRQKDGIEKGPAQEEPKKLPERGFNFVSVRTRPGTRK